MIESRKPRRKLKQKPSVYMKDNLFIDDIAKMKLRLSTLSPEKIIHDALKASHSSEVLNKKKYDNLEAIKAQAIIAINDVLNPNKTTTEINSIYKTKVAEYQTSASLVVAKKDQEHQECNQLLNSIKDKHKDLTAQKSKMEVETDKLLNQLSESKLSIRKLVVKYEMIEKMMPLFELVSTEFNTNDPDSVIRDIKKRKQEEEECLVEIGNLNSKVNQSKNDKRREYQYQKQRIEELSEQLFNAELANKDKSEKYDEEVRQIKDEIQSNYKHKVKHLLMQNMLSRLYNLLYPELNLEKGIKKSSSLAKLIEDDLLPNTSSNEEISRYIQNMILSSDRSKCGLLLRSTVAYSNMMLRKRIKEKVNEPYNPEFTFEEIENLIKTNEDELKRMKKIIEMKQDKIAADKDLIFKLQNEIKRQDDKYDDLLKSVQKEFLERIKKIKDLRSDSIKQKTVKRILTNKPDTTIQSRVTSINDQTVKAKSKKKQLKPRPSEYLNVLESDKLSDYHHENNKGHSALMPSVLFTEKHEIKANSKERRKLHAEHSEVSEGLKSLVDHTNRLFLFKTKSKCAKAKQTPMERIENKLTKLRRIQKSNQKPKEMSENILNHLDTIIYSIQKEDKS